MKTTVCALFALLLLWGCQKEVSYEGGVPPTIRKCIDCPYLPICDSSQFVYVNTSARGVDTVRSVVHVLGDTVINGQQYNSVSAFGAFSNGLYYNCPNAEYRAFLQTAGLGINIDSALHALTQQMPNLPANLIHVPDRYLATILKANANVGDTWTDTVYSVSLPAVASALVAMDYTLQEKGISYTVLGNNYSNVMHVKAVMRLNVSSLIQLPPVPQVNVTTDYYLSKGVGLIEMKVTNNGNTQLLSQLFSYHL